MAIVDLSACDFDNGVFTITYQVDDVTLLVRSVTYQNIHPVNAGSTTVMKSAKVLRTFTVPPNTSLTVSDLTALNITLGKTVLATKNLMVYNYPAGIEVSYSYPA